MNTFMAKPNLLRAGIAACVLLLAGGAAWAQSASVQLTASPQSTLLPDGQSVPMWGYTCGDVLTAAVPSKGGATCTAMNGATQSPTAWQPPLITVPANTSLTINLINALSFGSEAGQQVPTSIVIDGQLGGGLGTDRATMPSPVHAPQGTSWPGTLGGVDPATAAITISGGGAGYVLPPAVSISGGGGSGAAAVATIANGVVSAINISAVGTGYTSVPSVSIDPPPCTINATTCVQATATLSLATLQSSTGDATFVPPAQADRVRSFATEVAVGPTATALTWNSLRAGTYLIHSGTQPSIQHPMGLYAVLVVTDPASVPTTPSAYGVRFDRDVALLFSEIDPEQNRAVDQAVRTAGFSDTRVWDAQTGQCGDPAVHTCYPPAVNYSPLYYLVNGVSFDRTQIASPTFASAIAVPSAAAQGRLLLRLANAGLRLHVPSVVGASMTLVAEDGNTIPGSPRTQNQVPMNAGKTYDVAIAPAKTGPGANDPYAPATYAVYDRQLSLSTSNQRDGGMQVYLRIAGGAAAGSAGSTTAQSTFSGGVAQNYYCTNGTTLNVSDPARGLLAGVTGANGVALGSSFTGGVSPAGLTLRSNGTFTYVPPATGECAGSFTFTVNGSTTTTLATIANCASSAACAGARPVAGAASFTSNIASRAQVSPPGLLASVTNASGFALQAVAGTATGGTCSNVSVNADGSFTAAPPSVGAASCSFYYNVSTSTLQTSVNDGLVTVNFLTPSNLAVNVKDAKNGVAITDYRWIIEEDRTVKVDPLCQVNVSPRPTDSYGRPCPPLPVESQGYNFHTANMPVVAQGCVGAISCESGQTQGGTAVACDVGNGICRPAASKQALDPKYVHLDPDKHYFISVLPGDGVNPTIGGAGGPDGNKQFDIATACGAYDPAKPLWKAGNLGDATTNTPSALCGHAMGGAPIKPFQASVDIKLQQTPLPTAKIAVMVYQDDNPLNGENDAGGGVDVLAPNEPGLGGFEVKLFDQAGGLGDATGQITYDMFNQPVSNALANKIDPVTGFDACPINSRGDGLVGMIPTCPKYESDGVTLSPLAGQVVIANLYPGLYEIVATPAADRVARGEEWLQTNTLDGGKPHEAFIKPNEPGYFQEFGPGGFHVSIGFANPAIINARKAALCSTPSSGCTNTLKVRVANNHMSRTPDQRTFSSESYDHYSFTQCYVSVGPADAEDFAFQKCEYTQDASGRTIATATFNGMPNGVFKIAVFDQWNDIMLDGLVGTVTVKGDTDIEFPVTQWRTNLATRTFIDSGCGVKANAGDGVSQDCEPGLALVNTNIHYRDGSIGFFNNTDLNGYAGFNEVFPFMNWLVVETSSTRYKPTGVHTVYDAGGAVDGSSTQSLLTGWTASDIAANVASTQERVPLPVDLRAPGARYCDNADCLAADTLGGRSSGTVFPPQPWGTTMGWQGLLGQNTFIEFGVKPFKAADPANHLPAENGGIQGMVVYASTRPFDDPALSLQLSWEPGVPRVKVNLYSKTIDASGNEVLKLVDTTTSTSWDDWAQGFRTGADGVSPLSAGTGANAGAVPNMNCPGQAGDSPFFATLKNSTQWLDTPGAKKALAYQSQFKCYDGWSQLNQVQPAPYDGLYKFPSVTAVDPATGKPTRTNCSDCIVNPDDGMPMLRSGKYVVEVILPPGYELVKEEDKNILLGDVYIAPVAQQFAGFGNIFIMPDQAAVNGAYNASNPGGLNKTTNLGASPRHEGDTGSIEAFWPCVGAERTVPDLNSLFPGAGQAAPFAGARRRLCDRKEVVLDDQASVLTKFFIFSSTHIAGHFAGTITNDFASEFDPFSPQFGEKFGPPNLPVAMRDFTGNEVARVYSDQWGIYNGLYFSSYSVNPPNPTGYVPQMSIACMNDPGPILVNGQWVTDPAYNPAYSNFCYETPFMPGFTAYMDTPVIPTQAFADGYNLPDSEYPDATPAIKTVMNSSNTGPWIGTGTTNALTITALGDKVVQNPNYSGPNADADPYNRKTITRHYGFGASQGSGSAVLVAPDGTTTVSLAITGWSDTTINATVPTLTSAFDCKVQQRGAANTRCGELVVTAGNGKQSIDAITVTVGGNAPWVVTPNDFATNTGGTVTAPSGKSVKDYTKNFGRMYFSPIQTAIDSASPGDLILVQPGTYRENLIMWKPVRLQGVGAASVVVNADSHPAGKMDEWRREVVCAFGLDLDGRPNLNNANFDPSGLYNCPDAMFLKADRIPFEAITGWDASGNGNLAQVLQEPTLMGAYEGAGITTLGRGVRIPANSTDFWGADPTAAGAFADGSVYLSTADCTRTVTDKNRDYVTSNYRCNPSRVDGMSIINSSQGGGGVFVHGWGHNLEIANTRIWGNHGTLAGGINVGNGETPPVFLNDGAICGAGTTALCPPIPGGTLTNAAIPFGFNVNVRVHHNMIYNNASIGDALFTGTPAGAGGITVSAGGDNYQIDHNWIAANLSTGDGGGVQILGVNFNGRINKNYVLFNQSTNPTLPTNGGGIVVQGANEPRSINGAECGAATDFDCPPGLGDGIGAGLVIDGNLILGNSAESGSGGGLRLQQVNGSEMITFALLNAQWYGVTVSNNIIANNVAGWDGGGVALEDALKVNFVNNTVVANDTTASAGALFKTLGAVSASSPPPGCTNNPTQQQNLTCPTDGAPHAPQAAGLVTLAHTYNLREAIGNLPAVATVKVLCPVPAGQNYGYTGTVVPLLGSVNGDCMKVSKPRMVNDLFWHNRAFSVDVVDTSGNIVSGSATPTGTGLLSQQNLIALNPLLNQTATGACVTPSNMPSTFYYDVGLRTDDVVTQFISFTANKLQSYNSIISGDPQNVVTKTNPVAASSSPVVAEFCNGARVPPEKGGAFNGYNAPPGASETTSLATVFVFNGIKPAATVDEGHNWLNLTYGPLTLNRSAVNSTAANGPELMVATASVGVGGGSYSIPATSPAAGAGVVVNNLTPATDYFGQVRLASATAVGAVEVVVALQAPTLTSIAPASGNQGATVAVTLAGTRLTGASAVAVSGTGVTCSITGTPTATSASASCVIGATAATGARSVTLTTPGGTSGPVTFTVNQAPPVLAFNCPGSLLQQAACALSGTYPFGSVSTTATQTFTLSNTGLGSFTISSITVPKTNGGAGTYSVSGGTCAAGTTVLLTGQSCTVAVSFSSPTNSATNATLTVGGTGTGGVVTFSATRNLSGN